jgi:hypothetical protein
VRTMIENGISKFSPTNPYTREKLSFDTRQRLRKLVLNRNRYKRPLLHDETRKSTLSQLVEHTWMSVCQILEENAFTDINPNHFLTLNRVQLFIIGTMMHLDISSWACEHKKGSRRYRYMPLLKQLHGEYLAGASNEELHYYTGRCLFTMLNDYPNPYDICFIIMSALYRV